MNFSLPSCWTVAQIADLIELNPKNNCDDETVVGFVPMPLLGTSYRGSVAFESKLWGEVKKGYTHFAAGDVLLAKITPCFENGKAGIPNSLPNGVGAGSTEYFVCRPKAKLLEPRYLLAWFKTEGFIKNGAVEMTGSVGHKRVPKAYVLGSLLPLPPIGEQRRIADKLDAVLDRADKCRVHLDRMLPLLARFRQSVLAQAMSGELTATWSVGKAFDAKSQLASLRAKREGRSGQIEQTANHDVVLDNFSSRWEVGCFDDIFKLIDYRGKTPNKSSSGKRLISAKNIKMGFIKDEPVEYMSKEDYSAWMTRGFPRPGDILFVTEGHTMGCVAMNDRSDEFALAQRTITLQPFGEVATKFYFYYMLTNSFQKLVDVNATGSAAMGIKAAKLKGLPLPFPALEEQAEIVRRVERLFGFADQLEARVRNSLSEVERITPSLLARAFRGELVPQDPNDEPAADLLKRLAKERSGEGKATKGTRGRRAAPVALSEEESTSVE